MANNLSNKFRTIMLEIGCMFLEKEELLLAIMRGMLAGEHVLLMGVPGTAKSATIVEFLRRVTGANYFEYLLTKFSGMEEVFGPLDIQALQAGKYERLTDGYLPWAHVGFLDEIFKANSAILNALLTISNERKFKNGTKNLQCDLVTLVGASNETPQEDELTALYDRFMVRKISYPVSDSNFTKLLDSSLGKNAGQTTTSIQEWAQARKEVLDVKISQEIKEEVHALKVGMLAGSAPFSASDRRWRNSAKLLQAAAYLDGRDEVESDDLMVYSDVLWNDIPTARACADKVASIVNPALGKLLENIDAIDKLLGIMVQGTTDQERIDAKQKIISHKEIIAKLGKIGRKGEEALERIRVKEKAAIRKVLER